MTNPSRSPAAKRFFRALEEADQDPGLLDLRRTITRLEAIVQAHMGALEDSDSPDFRAQALELYKKGEMDALGELLERGAAESETLRDLGRAVDLLGKHVHNVWKINLDASKAINSKDLKTLLAEVAKAIFEELSEEHNLNARHRIIKKIDQIMRIGGVRDWEAIEG